MTSKPLTVKAIESLKPSASRREVPDGEVRGLYLQIFPSGKASWCFRYRFGGRTRKLTIGASPEIGMKAARDLARKAHLRIASGDDPGESKQAARQGAHAPANRDLVEKVAAQFLVRHVKGLAAATRIEAGRIVAKEILPTFRGQRLSEIKRPDVMEWLDAIVDRGAPISANRALSWFKGMANFAIQRGIIDVSPIAGIKPPTAETARDRVLSDAELKAAWQAADALEPAYAAFVQLLVLTGQRLREVSELHWSEIDLEKRVWTLPKERAKNSIEHDIPLSDAAISILQSIPRIAGSGFVFTISGRIPIRGTHSVKRRLDALMPPAPPWVLHDLRRTVASGMAKLGINLPVIEKLLNHVSGSFAGIVGVYQRHSFADEKRAAMTVWARHIEALVTGETAGNVVELKRG
ncbi:MAG: tyrosine-type recombinase/integrase [Pseudomonadota bacterium]|nr:tyrosine-type recombinase/integrase [Pseudomonadota bacterium]